jgi:hypothetical protein
MAPMKAMMLDFTDREDEDEGEVEDDDVTDEADDEAGDADRADDAANGADDPELLRYEKLWYQSKTTRLI